MAAMHIHTETDIAASADRVWAVLTDLAAYAAWNPLLTRMDGVAAVGETLRFEIALGRVRLQATAEVIVADRNRELRWVGPAKPAFRKVMSGEHYFVLDVTSPERTHLRHGEEFRGLVVPARGGKLKDVLTRKYEAVTEAIKQRAEQS
jgi:hypothetical protein